MSMHTELVLTHLETPAPCLQERPAEGRDRGAIPVLRGMGVTLRELRPTDAASLAAHLATPVVSKHLSAPPADAAAFTQFIEWARAEWRAGRCLSLAVVPDGAEAAVGLLQVHTTGGGWDTAEWGFALGQAWWGTGTFSHAASAFLAYVFDDLGVRRLESRTAARNGRAIAALEKLGGVCECVLSRAFRTESGRADQVLHAILASEWLRRYHVGTTLAKSVH